MSRREFAAATMAMSVGSAAVRNRGFRPGEAWLDEAGEAINAHGAGFLYEDGVYYWFGECRRGRDELGVSCYSSRDLYNWKNEGIVLAFAPENSDHPLAAGSKIERPKVVYNAATQQYVMWFHHELKGRGYSAARAGVAVANHANGAYRFVGSFRPDGEMARDLTVFVDEDGAAYLIAASEDNWTLHVHLLAADFQKTSGRWEAILPRRKYEAPAAFKRAGRYYLIGSHCTGWKPNPAISAVADSIWGPWEELGNPARGPDAELTFQAQSAYVLPVHGQRDAFIAAFDRWRPENHSESRYVWLPVEFAGAGFVVRWREVWDLSTFDGKA
jgi:hypothetical protein